jgi:hypothetical protein
MEISLNELGNLDVLEQLDFQQHSGNDPGVQDNFQT